MPSIKELRAICQNSKEAPSWRTQSLEGKFNRIFSIYLTWALTHSRIPVTAVNISGALLYLAGAFLFIFNNYRLQIVGLFLIFLSFVFDAADGELARYRKLPKEDMAVGGAYIEPVSHDIMYSFFFFPIGLGAMFATGSLVPLVASFIATVSKLLFRLAELRFDSLVLLLNKQKEEGQKYIQSTETPATTVYFIYRNFFTGTGMFFLLIFAVPLRHVDYFLYFYATIFFLLWCYKMMRLNKKIKKAKVSAKNPLI